MVAVYPSRHTRLGIFSLLLLFVFLSLFGLLRSLGLKYRKPVPAGHWARLDGELARRTKLVEHRPQSYLMMVAILVPNAEELLGHG